MFATNQIEHVTISSFGFEIWDGLNSQGNGLMRIRKYSKVHVVQKKSTKPCLAKFVSILTHTSSWTERNQCSNYWVPLRWSYCIHLQFLVNSLHAYGYFSRYAGTYIKKKTHKSE